MRLRVEQLIGYRREVCLDAIQHMMALVYINIFPFPTSKWKRSLCVTALAIAGTN